MTVLTGAEYRESLKELSPEINVRGERIDDVATHPLLKQTINHISSGLDYILQPEMRDRTIVKSPISEEDVSRLWMHIQQEKEDLTIKAELTREISSQRIILHPEIWAAFYDRMFLEEIPSIKFLKMELGLTTRLNMD